MKTILAIVLGIIWVLVSLWVLFRKKKVETESPKDKVPEPSKRLYDQTVELKDDELGINISFQKQDLSLEELQEAGHIVYELQTFLEKTKKWSKEQNKPKQEVKQVQNIDDSNLASFKESVCTDPLFDQQPFESENQTFDYTPEESTIDIDEISVNVPNIEFDDDSIADTIIRDEIEALAEEDDALLSDNELFNN